MMATSKDNLKDFLTCSICYEEFQGRDPRLLPCGHGFCLICIRDIHRAASDDFTYYQHRNEFRCPTCQTVSLIPQNSVDNFPKFFHANTLHDIYQDISKSTAISQQKWSVCWIDQQDVEGYCFTCTKSFCKQCLLAHNKNKRYSDHVLVQVNKDNIQCLVCTEHDLFVEAYCTDCERSVCGQCQLTTHNDHNTEDFIIGNNPDQDIMKEIMEKYQINENNKKRICSMQEEINTNIDFVKDQISKHTKTLIEDILEQSKFLNAELNKHQTDTNLNLEKIKTDVRESEKLVSQAEERLRNKSQPIPQLPDVRPRHMKGITTDIKQQLQHVASVKENITKFQYNPKTSKVSIGTVTLQNKSQLKQQVPSFVKLSHTRGELSHLPAERCRHEQETRENNLISETVSHTCTSAELLTEIENMGEVAYVSWTDTGELMAAVDGRVRVYDRSGKTMTVPFDLSFVVGRVHALDVHPISSAVAVVAGMRSDSNLYLTSLRNVTSALKKHSLPFVGNRVAFTSDGDVIVCSKFKIHKYKADCSEVWSTTTKQLVENITPLPDNKCLICGSGKVAIFDNDGQWISSFPSQRKLIQPRGVCTDSNGIVYVADYKMQCVSTFTEDGRFIKELLKVDGKPIHLTLYQDRYLCMLQQSQYAKLIIYSLI